MTLRISAGTSATETDQEGYLVLVESRNHTVDINDIGVLRLMPDEA
jgi:hypothetical protein